MCKMKTAGTGRDGMSVEVIAKTSDSHDQLIEKGRAALTLMIVLHMVWHLVCSLCQVQ